MKKYGIEIVEKRIVIPSDFLNKDYRYIFSFNLDRVRDNKEKKESFECPFCLKKYKKKKSLLSHVKNKHKVNYSILEKFVEAKKNIKKKNIIISPRTSVEDSHFRVCILNYLEKIESVLLNLLNFTRDYLLDFDVDTQEFSDELIFLQKELIILGFVRAFYTKIMVSDEITKDLKKYIYNEYKTAKRKSIPKAEGFCKICGARKAKENHHLIPVMYGGSSESYNLIDICLSCHTNDAFEVIFEPLTKEKMRKKILSLDVDEI